MRRSTHKLILDFVDPWWALGTPNSDTLASLFAAVAARRDTLRVLVAEGLDSEQDHQSIGLVGCLVHSMPALESLELGGWSDMESEVALTPPQVKAQQLYVRLKGVGPRALAAAACCLWNLQPPGVQLRWQAIHTLAD